MSVWTGPKSPHIGTVLRPCAWGGPAALRVQKKKVNYFTIRGQCNCFKAQLWLCGRSNKCTIPVIIRTVQYQPPSVPFPTRTEQAWVSGSQPTSFPVFSCACKQHKAGRRGTQDGTGSAPHCSWGFLFHIPGLIGILASRATPLFSLSSSLT